MKKLLPVALMFVSVAASAAEFSVTKSQKPNDIFRTGTAAFSMHRISGTDYPLSAAFRSNLKSIAWTSTFYPQSTGEEASLCNRRTNGAEICIPITKGASGSTDYFNNLNFEYAGYFMIKHTQAGGPMRSQPIGNDSLTFHMSY